MSVVTREQRRPVSYTPRRDCGLSAYERVLGRAGLTPVAGIDEAGRGACAGPLVVAAVMLKPSKIVKLTELADSKALTAKARNAAYRQIMDAALDWSVITIPAAEVDRLGLHVCNVAGMRRALAALGSKPGYVLTDGFPVRGLPAPALAMWKGDQVAACVAAASVIAKVPSLWIRPAQGVLHSKPHEGAGRAWPLRRAPDVFRQRPRLHACRHGGHSG